MQKTGFGLRTTIAVTIAAVMSITMLLVSFLVLTITRKTIFDYKIRTGETIVSSLQYLTMSSSAPLEERIAALHGTIENYLQTTECKGLTLVDSSQRVLFDSDKTRMGYRNMDPHLREALSSGELVEGMKSYQGRDHLFLSAPLYQGNVIEGALQAVLPLDDIERSMATFQHTLIVFTVTTALAFILMGSVLLSRYLVKPLEKLIRATEDITGGYLPHLPVTNGYNEIGTLSLSLARMTDKLRDDKQKIEHSIRSLEESASQLKRAQSEVIRSEKLSSVGRLAAGIAHEIGNPIGIILGYIELLRHTATSPADSADVLKRLENEVMRIDAIIRELLSFSRPAPVSPHPIPVNRTIEEATSFMKHQRAFQSIELEMHLAGCLPHVMADERQLQQVLVNLFLNAMDAMPQGGTLSIATALNSSDRDLSPKSPAGEPLISITVGDTGTGISPQELSNIFDPFYTSKSPGKGTGLGLSVCLSIIESFGGTLSVESEPGRGSAFTILLPALPAAQQARA